MGSCFSRPNDPHQNPSPPPMPHGMAGGHGHGHGGGGLLFNGMGSGHRMVAHMNLYKEDPLSRKGSAILTTTSAPPSGTMGSNGGGNGSSGTLGSRGGSSGGMPMVQKVIANYSYKTFDTNGSDIQFEKNDVMILLDESNPDWWFVKHPKSGLGYAPTNFIAKLESLESEEWFAGKLTRSMAEKLVSAPNLPRGTFLIRKRESDHEYALSINDSDNSRSCGPNVKHYKIKPLDDNHGYYITTRKVFPTIRDLVRYYSESSAGLCCNLTFPAPKMAPQRTDLSADTKNNWEIPRNELQLVEKLGDGNFGQVFYGTWRNTVEVAIKTMKPGTMSPDAFLREAHIMKQCNHPKLVRLYAVCTREEPFYIITEYMRNGSLLQYLKKPDNSLSHAALIDMCAQVAAGMMYLEDRKLVHRDLAARNILVGDIISGVPEIKIADFGLARALVEEDIYEAHTGAKFPIKWTAIEAAIYGNFTVKSDVWSFGILLYEMFTRSPPYPGMSNKDVIDQVERGYRMPRPSDIEEPVYSIMLKCWDANPERRPTFEFLHHAFEDYFVSSQPNYVPSSVDDHSFSAYRR